MKRRMVPLGIGFSLLLLLIVGCQSNDQEEVTLYAKSFDWSIQIVYQPTADGYVEIPFIEYLGEDDIKQVQLLINHKNNSFTSNRIEKENIADQGHMEMVTRSKVNDWKDTEDVTVKWEDSQNRFEETVKVTFEKPND